MSTKKASTWRALGERHRHSYLIPPPPPLTPSFREQTAATERAKEERLIKQFLDKCVEDDKKEAMARLARQEAIERFKIEVAAQRDIRQHLFAAQKLEEVRATEEAAKAEEFKKRVVAEARRRLLNEHAAVLRGFLPRGVITSNADLEILKAFDGNKDGVLSEMEMDLAQAAFAAYDPNAQAVGNGGGGGGGGGVVKSLPTQPIEAAARNRKASNASTVRFG